MDEHVDGEKISLLPIPGPGRGIAELRAELTLRNEWLGELVSPAKLGQIANDLGFGSFSEHDILGLWRIGMLRADYVESAQRVEMPGLIDLKDDGRHLDLRSMERRLEGYGSSMPVRRDDGSPSNMGPEIRFHPYRVYVLHHLVRTLVLRTSNCQYLSWKPGVKTVADHVLNDFDRWSSSPEFSDRFDYWNQLSELAALCTAVLWLPPEGHPQLAEAPAWLPAYVESMRDYLRRSGLLFIRKSREDLAWAAHARDPNDNIHTLIRLMRKSERDRVGGPLGSAIQFRAMAESIRRACERLLDLKLPEEDELGPGQWMEGARKMLYGHERVFDAPKRDLRDFLGILGLDFGVKVRCYVEGETELGAFRHAVGVEGQCSIVNLKGNVVQRGGKGISFADSLAEDMRDRVISVVIVDGDRAEVVRTLRRAAYERRMHGPFFLSEPDFEFANFTTGELARVAAALAVGVPFDDAEISERVPEIMKFVSTARSGKDFLQLLRNAGAYDVGKGERWGQALMAYAIEHQKFPDEDARAGREREIVNIARTLIRAQDVGYLRSVQQEEVDPSTGKMVSRKRQNAPPDTTST